MAAGWQARRTAGRGCRVKLTVTIGEREYRVDFDEGYGNRSLRVDGTEHRLTLLRLEGDRLRITVDDQPIDAILTGTLPDLLVDVGSGPFAVKVEETRFAEVRKISGQAVRAHAAADLKAPMPGLVTRVLVQAGDAVSPGTPLLVMEAMKMENELRSQGEGRVAEIKVSAQQPVEQGQVLITFTPDGAG